MRHVDSSKVLAAALSYTQQEIANVEVKVVEMLENLLIEQEVSLETLVPMSVDGYMDRHELQGPRGIQGKQGERGDPFLFEDFTEEQLDYILGKRGS